MKDRWKTSKGSVYNINYHLIWCPKYRRKVLEGEVEKRLKELLKNKANDLELTIKAFEVMPDHVHLFISAPPTASPHWVVQQFKGNSSRILRQEFPSLKSKLPTLWTRSYYCESVGHISEETIKKYVEDQKKV